MFMYLQLLSLLSLLSLLLLLFLLLSLSLFRCRCCCRFWQAEMSPAELLQSGYFPASCSFRYRSHAPCVSSDCLEISSHSSDWLAPPMSPPAITTSTAERASERERVSTRKNRSRNSRGNYLHAHTHTHRKTSTTQRGRHSTDHCCHSRMNRARAEHTHLVARGPPSTLSKY